MTKMRKCPGCGEVDVFSTDAYGYCNCQKCGKRWKPIKGQVVRVASFSPKREHSDGSVDLSPIGQDPVQDSIFGMKYRR